MMMRTLFLAVLISFYAMGLVACSLRPPSTPSPEGLGSSEGGDPGLSPMDNSPKRFLPPTEIDKLLDAKPHHLPGIKPAGGGMTSPDPSSPKPGSGGPWRIQVGSMPDLESAETRKRELDAKLEGAIEISFDPPYYKLRWGGFATRQEAEDKLLEISETIREGFVVRQ